MAEKKNVFKINEIDQVGSVQVSEEVLAIIASLAATEIDGIASVRDGLSGDQISKANMKSLAKSVKVTVVEDKIVVQLVLNMKYGYSIPDTTKEVQLHVKEVMENMTGLTVKAVHVSIADVEVKKK